MRQARLVVALAVAGVVVLSASPAAASCAQEAGPAGAPVIFVGTPQAERRGYTQFAVTEVWAGPDLAPQVWVLSGQEQPPWPLSLLSAVGSSVDAEFDDGEKYIVGASRSFATNACLSGEAVNLQAPVEARKPSEDGSAGADPPMGPVEQGLSAAGGLAALAAVTRLLHRRRTAARTAVVPTTT